MKKSTMNSFVVELHLLLIYLTGWEEPSTIEPGVRLFKSWKGFLYEVLDTLAEQDLIVQNGSTELMLLTDKGRACAQELLKKYEKGEGKD